jgi:PKHD-type hydroxylase
VIELANQAGWRTASVGARNEGGDLVEGVIRTGDATFLDPADHDCRWVWDKLHALILQANRYRYGFELEAIETVQVAKYSAAVNAHYTWHVDIGADRFANRKLGITVQLSDSRHYTGGNLEFAVPNIVADRHIGSVTIFPSWMVHRVSPVTQGTRYSIASWFSGPRFR